MYKTQILYTTKTTIALLLLVKCVYYSDCYVFLSWEKNQREQDWFYSSETTCSSHILSLNFTVFQFDFCPLILNNEYTVWEDLNM